MTGSTDGSDSVNLSMCLQGVATDTAFIVSCYVNSRKWWFFTYTRAAISVNGKVQIQRKISVRNKGITFKLPTGISHT